jgi:uncharacterized protein DUF4157
VPRARPEVPVDHAVPLQLAADDDRVVAAAAMGSLAVDRGDRFSDLDLTFGIADEVPVSAVLADWTTAHRLIPPRRARPTCASLVARPSLVTRGERTYARPMSQQDRDRLEPLEDGHERPPETQAAVEPAASPTSSAETVASAVGNQAFGQLVGRTPGDGIMAGGVVHPDVAATIATTNGSGHTLDPDTRERLAPRVGDPLTDVRVHTDTTADALARSVSARAFTTGSDVYFAAGEYRPGSADGDSLLAHELTHVTQQRGAPSSGPLTVSEPGDAMETEADTVAGGLDG